jgi:hypothetical protein
MKITAYNHHVRLLLRLRVPGRPNNASLPSPSRSRRPYAIRVSKTETLHYLLLRGRGRLKQEPELEGAAAGHAPRGDIRKYFAPGEARHASCPRRGVPKNSLDTASRFQRWLPATLFPLSSALGAAGLDNSPPI